MISECVRLKKLETIYYNRQPNEIRFIICQLYIAITVKVGCSLT